MSFLQAAIKHRNASETDAFREVFEALSAAQVAKRELQRATANLTGCESQTHAHKALYVRYVWLMMP